MAGEIENSFGVRAEQIPGSGGIFDVEVDGKLIFSRQKTGRFPENIEVIEAIKKLQ